MKVHMLAQHSFSASHCYRRVVRFRLVTCKAEGCSDRACTGPRMSERNMGSRRGAILAIGTAVASLVLTAQSRAEEEQQVGGTGKVTSTSSSSPEEFKVMTDGFLAYTFKYPATIQGNPAPVIFSRKPERYSSAAPLTPDARQRIVAELVSFPNGVTISVSVGPPSAALSAKPVEQWKAKEVADTVLQDRSTARVTTGQRVSLNSIESAVTETRDGQTYFAYEHLSQGSPSISSQTKETYRHAWSVTSTRPALDKSPYLYTLTLSCPDERWPALGPIYEECQKSFRLTPTTKDYVPPDKDPLAILLDFADGSNLLIMSTRAYF